MEINLKPKQVNLETGIGTFKLILTAKDLKDDDNHPIFGICDFDSKTITVYVGKKSDEDIIKNTLLHELTHLALYLMGMSADENIPKDMTNEFLTDGLSNQLWSIFRLNPYLMELLAY